MPGVVVVPTYSLAYSLDPTAWIPTTLDLDLRLRVMSSCGFGSDFTLATFDGQLLTGDSL
jgi:hypothetical protein